MVDQKGFTLVELIAVMIILGIIASIAAVKFMSFDSTAANEVLNLAIEELNTREKLVWFDVKLSFDGDVEENVWNRMQHELGMGDGTKVSANEDGGTITVRDASIRVSRTHPSSTEPGRWTKL